MTMQPRSSEKIDREELARRGFERVFDYASGMSDWRNARRPVAGTS